MTGLVDDLLSLSRVEETERVRPREPVDLGALAQSTINDLGPLISESGGTVDVINDSSGATIAGDPVQLRQVLVNLIENALKYGAEHGAVRVGISAVTHLKPLRSEGIVLSVSNDGPGIASHHIPRLTERFYRVDSHRSRQVGGTGLGLAIVKHIVNRHRGRLKIDSAKGQGVTVRVLLPVN